MVPVSFADHELLLMEGRAVYWPREQALLVADLHLEKASYYAKHGQMLPPYDSRETLERIADAVKLTGARRVITLGDNFHDNDGTQRLEPYAAGMLEALTRALDWIWITGNHDELMARAFGGTLLEELEIGGAILRHQAKPGEIRPELSGHYHPKIRVKIRQRHIARACAVRASIDGAERIILPAFGALTGGMDAGDPAIVSALQPARAIDALIPIRGRLSTFPLWRTGDTYAA